MSMPHPEPPSSLIHGELKGKIISPPLPAPPPMPPPGAGIEIMRDTIEVQARTIRYLLSNYEALLRKVERDLDEEDILSWTEGAAQTIAAGAAIPAGLWIVGSTSIGVNHTVHGNRTIDAFDLFYADGTTLLAGSSPIQISPLQAKIKSTTNGS